MDFGSINSPPYPAWIQIHDSSSQGTNYPLALQPNGGNVGIGTTNPGTAKLAVMGGSVGIGTTTPSQTFVVNGEIAAMGYGGIGGFASSAYGRLAVLGSEASAPALYVRQNGAGDIARFLTGSTVNMAITNAGNVGIGTTTPGTYKLYVAGGAKFENPIEVGSPTASNHATTKSYVDSILGTGGTGTSTASFNTLTVTGTTTLASTAGKVIIGGAGPALKLDVTGQGQFTDTMSATKYYDYNDLTYYIDPANTGTSLKLGGSIQSDGTGISYINGQFAVGTTTPGAYKLYVNGTSYFNNQVTIKGGEQLVFESSSSSIAMAYGNIGTVGKLTVQTIDPLYEIDGEKYATYASSIAGGVKEEYVGRRILAKISNSQCSIFNQASNTNDSIDSLSHSLKTENCKLQNYAYVIDFNKVERGSDLWVWYQAIDFGKDTVQAIATPYGTSASVGYVIEGKTIKFFANEPTEFSFRLIGNRHDWKNWPTYSKDQKEKASFILKAR